MQQIHLIRRLENAACPCRSSLPTCASCWESHLPRGAAALPTFHGMFGPCSWRKRVGQVSGQTASPTSSSWTASITEQEPDMNHNVREHRRNKNGDTPASAYITNCSLAMTLTIHSLSGSHVGSDIYTSHHRLGRLVFFFPLHTEKGN